MSKKYTIVYEGDLTQVKLLALYLRNNGISCKVEEVTPGFPIYRTSKIFVKEKDYDTADFLVRKYMSEAAGKFKPSYYNSAVFGLICFLFIFGIMSSIFSGC